MMYKQLANIHAILAQEVQRRNELYLDAAAHYDQECNGPHRTTELTQLAYLRDDAYAYYSKAAHALNDFENQDFH